jgi:hypothetical protein
MKLFTSIFLLFALNANSQLMEASVAPSIEFSSPIELQEKPIKIMPVKWKLTGNHLLTGGLIFMAGASKGFNETLNFHWKGFEHMFQDANPQWFNPEISWRNKYENGDPFAGPKFPLSTTALVMFTDQYHLNNFINKLAWTSAIVIKIGEGKKPLKHYVYDLIYYTACHQAGFALTYYPFKGYRPN